MKLSIISPTSQRSLSVDWIEVETSTGNMVIQEGHAPTILILSPNKPFTFGMPGDKTESFIPTDAILHVQRTSALLIISDVTL